MTQILAKRQGLNKKLEQLQQENRTLRELLSQSRKLANVGLTCSMVGHEINNVLTPLSSYSQLALIHPKDAELSKKAHKKTVKNCQRAKQILERLQRTMYNESAEKKPHNAAELVENALEYISRDFSKDGITVIKEIENGMQILCVAVDAEHILINLILNARDAMLGKGGQLHIKAYSSKQGQCVEISDTGCGMEKELLADIFEPFFTTKNNTKASGGSGLGLAICKEIIDSHNGLISVESEPDKGTKFKITFPNTLKGDKCPR